MNNNDMLKMFGLTKRQCQLLFSIEMHLVKQDIGKRKKTWELKQKWLNRWKTQIEEALRGSQQDGPSDLLDYEGILDAIQKEHAENPDNNTWYYLIMLEATLFKPYMPLGESKDSDNKDSDNKDSDKEFSKLQYDNEQEILEEIKGLVKRHSIMSETEIDRFKKLYTKSIARLTGKGLKVAIALLVTIAVAAITAATAGAFAGPIAAAIYGSSFPTLSGAALTSACLAMAGGGALAVGGAGMAGGVLAIVGGGALLGTAVGGTASGVISLKIAKTSPQLVLMQAAKLEVVLQEIVINLQDDLKCAQDVLKSYKEQISNLQAELVKLELEREKNKKEINALKKTIEYMKKAYKHMSKFQSSYEVGKEFENN